MGNMYLVPEFDLKSILHAALILNALERGGVDNWNWYGESISDFISEWKEDHDIPKDKEIYMEDIVEEQMQHFKKI